MGYGRRDHERKNDETEKEVRTKEAGRGPSHSGGGSKSSLQINVSTVADPIIAYSIPASFHAVPKAMAGATRAVLEAGRQAKMVLRLREELLGLCQGHAVRSVHE